MGRWVSNGRRWRNRVIPDGQATDAGTGGVIQNHQDGLLGRKEPMLVFLSGKLTQMLRLVESLEISLHFPYRVQGTYKFIRKTQEDKIETHYDLI